MTTLKQTKPVIQSAIVYTMFFFTLAFGNSFTDPFTPLVWMFGVSFWAGYFHQQNFRSGLKFFIVPTLLLTVFACALNFQWLFVAEAVTILLAYFVGSRITWKF